MLFQLQGRALLGYKVSKELMSMNDTLQRMYAHRTIRAFTEAVPTEAELAALVRAARHTPTYKFQQTYSLIGVEDKDKQRRLAEICGQAYVAEAGYLFLIVADWARNMAICRAKGAEPTEIVSSADSFLAAIYDATLVTMNMVTAAESMGLGAVVLGSVNNDMQATIDLFELPRYTFPCLGLAVGTPDQSPQLKPRLPAEIVFMKDRYEPLEAPLEALAAYDDVVHEYYDLRDANRRVDRFTDQMTRALTADFAAKRGEILEVLHRQGLLLR